MGTNGMRQMDRVHESWRGLAIVAALIGGFVALLLYGRNVLLWLITGLGLVAVVLTLVLFVRANRSLKGASNGLCARCLLGAARRIV